MKVLQARPKEPRQRRWLMRRGRLWGNPHFMKLWAGQSVSLLGDQVSLLAFPLIAVLTLHASAFQTGALTAAAWAPSVIAPFVGAWVDGRPDRRRLMVGADAGRCALVATVPAAAAFGVLTMAQLYAVAFAMGALSVVFDLALSAYFLAMVEPGDIVEAQAKVSVSRSGADIAGPGLAGALVQLATAPFAVLADAVSFLASAAFIARIRAQELPSEREGGAWRRIREGFSYTFEHPVLRACLQCATTLNLFNFVLWGIVILFATRTLGLSPGVIGATLSLAAVGAMIGSLTAERIGRRLGVGPAVLLGAVLFPVPSVLIPLAGGPHWLAAGMLGAAEFLAGVGVMYFDVNIGSLILVVTPQRLRARSRGAFRSVNFGVRPIGALLGGLLGSLFGLRPTLFVAAAGASLAFVWLLFSPIPKITELPDPAP